MDASFATEGTYTPDNLIAGGDPSAQAEEVTLLSGESVVRGEVLGIITASGKAAASLSASTDGSETPRLIAAEAMDASAADKKMHAYTRGRFNQDQLTIGTGHTAASIKQGLWDYQIYLVDPVTATPV
jgi:hypothetical protein